MSVRLQGEVESMAYPEAKVYFDGSHYIAIPHTTRMVKKKKPMPEKKVEVNEDLSIATPLPYTDEELLEMGFEPVEIDEDIFPDTEPMLEEKHDENPDKTLKNTLRLTYKEVFEELYQKTQTMKYRERVPYITEHMRQFFHTDVETRYFVTQQFNRKQRNLIARRMRMARKAALVNFNYFVTFTYDDKLHTEESFKKDLAVVLRRFSTRKAWKYIGVWERSHEKKRLHFHGIFSIPEASLPGLMVDREDYNFSTHKRQVIRQNSYFLMRFGRNDFEPIEDPSRKGEALAYLMKYIDKSGEKIIYSKGMYPYFISDILDDDVVMSIEKKDRVTKLILFDDFSCFDEGVYIGPVSEETIAQLRKSN